MNFSQHEIWLGYVGLPRALNACWSYFHEHYELAERDSAIDRAAPVSCLRLSAGLRFH
jgi:hypothetical protein